MTEIPAPCLPDKNGAIIFFNLNLLKKHNK